MVDHALTNAREALGRRLAETSSQARLLKGLAETFGLPHTPRRIEVYDNSHIMGTNAVGGMIVAGPEGFVKNQYRKFNIKSTDITPGDDFGMMREVIERRFSRLVKEHGEPEPLAKTESLEAVNDAFPAWPDVILIDGGQGQVGAVRQILGELGINHLVTAIGIAKGVDREAGRERFLSKVSKPLRCRRAIRFSTSSSACAMKHTVSPLAHIGQGARRKWLRIRSMKSRESVQRASVRFSIISVRQRRYPERQLKT